MKDAQNESFEPKIVAFLCTWCSYTGADTAGIARLKTPANVRAIRVPCSGRVAPELVLRAFDGGADGVLVLGCHIGECHYETGNHRTAKRLPVLGSLLAFIGLEPERFRLDWVSASEGERFARIVNEFVEAVRAVGPSPWTGDSERFSVSSHPFADRSRPVFPVPISQFPVPDPQSLQEKEDAIRETARELLASGAVQTVIGYETGPRGRTRPAFVRSEDQAGRLVWNGKARQNLCVYLPHTLRAAQNGQSAQAGRAAVVVKPCDSRAINVLLAENRIDRERVHVIGVVCDGLQNRTAEGEAFLEQRCANCSQRVPVVSDTLIGQAAAESPGPAGGDPLGDLEQQLWAQTPAERAAFWNEQFDRCLRCYACRQACPMCDCPLCLFDRDDSLWTAMRIERPEKRTFHLGRAYHLAGRCVGCNACSEACPVGIPLGLFNRMLAHEMAERFEYRAGAAPVPSPFVTILEE